MKKFIVIMLSAILLGGCGVVESTEYTSSEVENAMSSEKDSALSLSPAQQDTQPAETSDDTTDTAESAVNHITVGTFTIPASDTETAVPVQAVLSNAEAHLAKMTLHEKVCQMFIAVPEAVTDYDVVTYVDCSFHKGYADYPVGGIIFFAKNIETSEQTSAMVRDMQDDALFAGTGAFMAIDEEGGTVTRIQSKLGTEAVYDMNYYGSLNDRATAFSVGATIGSYLSDYGINLDFAPVADVNISPYNELGSRIFSTDPQIVADMSGAVVEGLHSEGVCSTLKHFPGLGAGNGNTHYNSVWIDRTHDQLVSTEFPAFQGGINAGSDFVMVGHQITSASGDNLPGDLSHVVVTDWLRGELGFNGIAVTDSHSMGAISNAYTSGEAAVLAIEAGIDMVLMPYNLAEAVAGVEQAVESGRLTEERIDESVIRILEKKDELGLI
ncbi:MAG: glycoside hydrolase family 3 protein [Ruminococcus flavefaciens]|nr:glycoside hydrolase family 3 protein [Ruminococcus flavefaciens]